MGQINHGNISDMTSDLVEVDFPIQLTYPSHTLCFQHLHHEVALMIRHEHSLSI